MRMLLALLGVAAMIGLAAPAYGDPDSSGDDAGFLAALRNADIGYGDPGQAIGAAQAVCGCLDNGESGLELIHDVKTHNPALDLDTAAQFSLLAAKYYCPHHLSKA
jgi:hypothetical protein